jgi:TonB-dependent starch-binding outer membrane protein SusC
VVANETRRLDASGTGLGAPDVTVIGTATTTTGTNTFSEQNSVGIYLQQAIVWRDRLFFSGAVRADDNSSFGTDFDIIVYPKLGLSWILTQEPALDRVFSALHADEFKFRTAWGRAGRAPAPYSAVQTYTISKTTLGGTTSTSVPMLRTLAYGNPNLAPEKGEELEVGFDAGFFDGRAGADFTFYTKRTTNLLLSIPVAPSNGFPGSIIKNVGEVSNRGIELSLFGTPIQLDRFVWETRLNIATNRNRLESFGVPGRVNEIPALQAYGQVQEHRAGYPLGGYWTQLPRRNAAGGDSIANGRIVIDTAKVYIGPSTPTREIGLSNTLTLFRNFRLYALVDYKGGHFLYNRKEYDRCVSNENCELVTNPAARMGTDTALAARLPYFRTVNFFRPFIEESDFVKLRDISLSFIVPRAWVARAGAQGLTLTLAGKNLAQWTDYSGLDPEVNTYGGRNFLRVDAYASPAPRRWSLSGALTY